MSQSLVKKGLDLLISKSSTLDDLDGSGSGKKKKGAAAVKRQGGAVRKCEKK